MKVLLKEDVFKLGSVGDEVEVKDGYGRNFLIPTGKALLATPKNLKQFRHQKSIVDHKVKKFKGVAQTVADQLAKLSLSVKKKVGEQGKLFGAVTSQEIADLVAANGVEIDSGCLEGNCGSCMTAILSGEVTYADEPSYPYEKGTCLTCSCVPNGPLELDA